MRICAGYLHQVQGTLRMVELYAPAMVAEELEQLANAIGAGRVADRDEACATLMRGSVLLPDYLERLQNGHRDIPIVLMPLLNEIRASRGEEGVTDSVLAFAPESVTATEAELDHARGSLSGGRNRELLDTVGSAVKEELLRIRMRLTCLRTGGAPEQLQTQANELGAVADTLGMMGLGVARGVVVQQRDALRGVVEGRQQIDENLLLDIAGALLYVDASLDDQVAHLGAGGSGEDDPSAVENRRTVEVLAHEAIANFAAAREHFVAFIETSWNHAELQDVPRLLGDVSGALRMLDLGTAADYLRGVQRYIEAELIGRQRVPVAASWTPWPMPWPAWSTTWKPCATAARAARTSSKSPAAASRLCATGRCRSTMPSRRTRRHCCRSNVSRLRCRPSPCSRSASRFRCSLRRPLPATCRCHCRTSPSIRRRPRRRRWCPTTA